MRKNLTISDTDLRSVLHIDSETRSGQYICTCPFCSKEKHFYINRKTQLFDCKKCFVSGSIYKLLKHLDKIYLLGDKSVEITDEIKSIRTLSLENSDAKEEERKELPIIRMPAGFRHCVANKYLSYRGITRKDVKRYGIGETRVLSKYSNYILFPIYDDGKIRGYVGRYGAKKVPTDKLRYKNSLNTDFAALLYGYDEIVEGSTEVVIIVEGIFDKIACDKKLGLWEDDKVKCVCTFGKKISDIQIQKLIDKKISSVILSFDYDALKEIKQYGTELDYYFRVYAAVNTFKKDIDECSQEEVIEVFSNVKPIRNFVIDVIGKLKR